LSVSPGFNLFFVNDLRSYFTTRKWPKLLSQPAAGLVYLPNKYEERNTKYEM